MSSERLHSDRGQVPGVAHEHRPDSSGAALEGSLMAVARGLRRGWADQIAHTGLAPHQARALRVIAAEGSIRPGALAERLHVAPRSVTEVVDALVERELVSREPDPSDRRAMTLTLTEAGHELVGEIGAIRRAHTEQVFGAVLSREEQDTLAALLGRLADRLSP
ncbi:MarR family transcriptional regulator [Nostocoides sp. F2B08]|uniref:MarR family winged helix-turn-helix transcriptional regulator n=1 Tax=Nostocoides sp. F2B08 TaxID=2653936 RepID=UPI00126315FF|nr:MarR family winged helix-turn-helix transcriptional regulator [Tetrasphaera sp. F2B08]KAB7745537.1 MarR family transcriptional regulator [Tetrasphaera sp. F2B08]